MTSDLDAKGPHVQSDEHNDPSGIAARLIRLAQQFEDQHAPMTVTLLLREAANRLSNHRTETLEYLGQVGQLSDELDRVRAALQRLHRNASPMTRGWIDAALKGES
jgi:hypothetical protein